MIEVEFAITPDIRGCRVTTSSVEATTIILLRFFLDTGHHDYGTLWCGLIWLVILEHVYEAASQVLVNGLLKNSEEPVVSDELCHQRNTLVIAKTVKVARVER